MRLGSTEEQEDIEAKYLSSGGSLPSILASIPHSTYADESRIIELVNSKIDLGKLESTKKWESTSTDKATAEKRRRKSEKEAKEAEKAAKDLGVWDEFYGSGEKGKRKGEKKESAASAANGGEDALTAMILKRQNEREGGLDGIAAKYTKIEEEARARKKAKRGSGKKGANAENVGGATKEMTDEEFAALQEKMFGEKDGKKGKKAKA